MSKLELIQAIQSLGKGYEATARQSCLDAVDRCSCEDAQERMASAVAALAVSRSVDCVIHKTVQLIHAAKCVS